MIAQILEFFRTLADPLAVSIFAFVIYNVIQLGNIVMGSGVAQLESDEAFDKDKFIKGLKKGLRVGFTVVTVVVGATGITTLVGLGFDIPFSPEEAGITALVVVFGSAGVMKLTEVLKKIGVYTGFADIIANVITSDKTVIEKKEEE